MIFRDRFDAGRRLAESLMPLRGQDLVVLALPRGGVPVAAEVARALEAPLDVLVVRKLGLPSQPEFAMGAIGEGGVRVMDDYVVRSSGVTARQLDAVEAFETAELNRRARRFRGGLPRVSLVGRTAIIVDDGIATGSTALAACIAARKLGASRVVVAAPVASAGAARELRRAADAVVCLETPRPFYAVGQFYADFRPTSDEEVVDVLKAALQQKPATRRVGAGGGRASTDEEVHIVVGSTRLAGRLTIPARAVRLVLRRRWGAS